MKKDNKSLQSNDGNLLLPVKLRPEEEDLCKRLDGFYKFYKLNKKPSDYYRGAIFAAKKEIKSNPDWLAQATHSFREILYPFFSHHNKKIKERKIKAFEKFGTVGAKLVMEREIGAFWGKLNRISHHEIEIDFEFLRQEFVKILNKALAYQLDVHGLIDGILKNDSNSEKGKQSITEIKNLIFLNSDTRQYFFYKADERWLEWLWKNGFLDVIKQEIKDPTQYGYRMPELNYLARAAEKKPKRVVDIILTIPTSKENFNPEVVDRFLRICSALPAQELKGMIKKIRDEEWIRLMGAFNEFGFEYEKMFEVLVAVKDYKSILMLAEAVLSVRTKEEIRENSHGLSSDNPFYFSDLSYIKVFENLIAINNENAERALELTTKTMAKIVLLGDKSKSNEVFSVREIFYLFDIDFFALEPSDKKHLSSRDDVRELAATIKYLAKRLIEKRCDEVKSVRAIYKKYIQNLPDSRLMWRLRLFVLGLCPEVFKNELKNAFFRLFEVKHYHEIISGAEYQRALQKGFFVLKKTDKREYIKRVIDYFVKRDREKENEKENWHIEYGSRIFSMIIVHLTKTDKQTAKDAGFILDPKYEPEPSISKMRGGTVIPRGPITTEEFCKLQISDITKKLRTEWTPEKLRKQNTRDNFLNPLNAEGLGELLRADIAKRLQDYINNANFFFEREKLDPHYTYSFLLGIQEAIRKNRIDISGINCDNLISLCMSIKESGEDKSFDRETRESDTFDAWLANWTAVHSAITDVVQELLNEKNGDIIIDFSKYRGQLLAILSYLLFYSNPVPEDEKIESSKMKIKSHGDEEYFVSDPFSMAINTVRGRAFQAFVLFVYQDSKKFFKNKVVKIDFDAKRLYETVLKKENTRALMFMFGHYLPSFYFRDKKWIQGLFPQIFSEESEKKHLYTAAWEGYLSTNIYKELFFDPDIQKLYEQGLALAEADYQKQKHFKEPDESIAIHLALAFIHFSDFGFQHNLFKEFWGKKNLKRHKEFISFIGQHSISREAAAEWIKYNKIDIEKLKKFWDWALEHCDSDELTGFGFWINAESSPLDTRWLAQHTRQTLEKTKGYIEREYGLIRSFVIFAEEAPEDTLRILRAYLLEEVAQHDPVRAWPHIDREVFDAFNELYKNKAMRDEVRTLINDLLPHRNGLFWELKSVLKESSTK